MEIEKDPTIKVSSIIEHFEKPDKVYIPVYSSTKIYPKLHEEVSIGTPLVKIDNITYYSPISGTINGLKEINTVKGTTKALEIINNFIEKKITNNTLKRANIKKEILEKILLNEFNLNLQNTKSLIINAIDDEPYVVTENFYLFLYYEDILEIVDKIAKIFKIPEIIICVKSSSSENLNKLMNYMGMYPNIKLEIVPDLYLIGQEKYLNEYLNLENPTIIKSSTMYDIFTIIKKNRPLDIKIITISGNALIKPFVVAVKLGTKLLDIITSLVDFKTSDYLFISNGLMSGNIIDINNYIVTKELDSVLIMHHHRKEKTNPCLNCGLCLNVCPEGLNPLMFHDKKYFDSIKSTCLKCGLCSYICPSHIDFSKYYKGEENE